ncbi:uncharacterized protein LOC144158765 [Haemaphysalis longicornis]
MASCGSGGDDYPHYVLTGFGPLLDWRPLQFVGSRQPRNVCDACSVIAISVKVTPCSHFFCFFCWEMIALCETTCPVCDREIPHNEVLLLNESCMDDYEVRCFNATRGCPFEGPLSVMKRHFIEHCGYGQARCPRCHNPVSRERAVEHRMVCKFSLLPAGVEAQEPLSHIDISCTMPQHAHQGGDESTNTTRSPEKADAAREMGAFGSAADFSTSAKRGPELVVSELDTYISEAERLAVEPWASPYSRRDAYRRDMNVSTPEARPSTSAAEAGLSSENKPASFRSKGAHFQTRGAPRFAAVGTLRSSGKIVTTVARSKPWAGPTEVVGHLPTHVRDLSSSPPGKEPDATEPGKLSLAEFLTVLKKEESPGPPSVLRRLLLSDSAASYHLDSVKSNALARKERRVTSKEDLATSAAANVTEAAGTSESATGASNLGIVSEASLSDHWMFCSSTADVPAFSTGVNAADPGDCGQVGAPKRRRHSSMPEAPSQPPTVPPIAVSDQSTSAQLPSDYACDEPRSTDVIEQGRAESSAHQRDVLANHGSSEFVIPKIVITDCSTPEKAASRIQGNVDLLACRRTSLKVPPTHALNDLYSERLAPSLPPSVISSLTSSTDGALCCFPDVMLVRPLLEGKDMLLIRSDEATVFGYTFNLSCLFRRSGGAVSVAFEFCFVSGESDDLCLWPFDGRLALQLVHPEDSSMNFSWTLLLSQAAAATIFRKPSRNTCNPGCLTEFLCWEDIETAGFIGDGFLRVYVAFKFHF